MLVKSLSGSVSGEFTVLKYEDSILENTPAQSSEVLTAKGNANLDLGRVRKRKIVRTVRKRNHANEHGM